MATGAKRIRGSSAEDGLEGLEKATTELPDLILMDICLPELGGLDVTRQLQENKETRDIPLIILITRFLKRDRGEALSAGCDDFDVKPIDFNRLLEKIVRLLVNFVVYSCSMANIIDVNII